MLVFSLFQHSTPSNTGASVDLLGLGTTIGSKPTTASGLLVDVFADNFPLASSNGLESSGLTMGADESYKK